MGSGCAKETEGILSIYSEYNVSAIIVFTVTIAFGLSCAFHKLVNMWKDSIIIAELVGIRLT